MRAFLILILLFFSYANAQHDNYPKDYFISPLDIPLKISGTFAELRSNHFHAGLDIKTNQKVGLPVKASASGYVSRIKISHYGCGKALYVTHPNGYTSVYAHLKTFSPAIEAYVKKQQYKKKSYEIELFPKPGLLNIIQDRIVAYSGNSGGSGGPHLHFEIRDNAQRPINPMLFGIDIEDTRRPLVKSIYVYPIGNNAHVNQLHKKQKLTLKYIEKGIYEAEHIEAMGDIGFGIQTTDKQNLSENANGVYNIKTVSYTHLTLPTIA